MVMVMVMMKAFCCHEIMEDPCITHSASTFINVWCTCMRIHMRIMYVHVCMFVGASAFVYTSMHDYADRFETFPGSGG
jgi:hypothetical protein